MTLELILPADLEHRLRQEAEWQGVSVTAVTLKLLADHLPPADRQSARIAMLHQWQAEDEALTPEDAAANAEVLRAIDEDRLSDRKLVTKILEP
jgi:hypothetical protein